MDGLGYRLRLARPGWVGGSILAAAGVAALALLTAGADSVNGTVSAARGVAAVLAIGAAAPLLDLGAAVLDATPYSRARRRLGPVAIALLALGAVGVGLATAQAVRLEGVPWSALALQAGGLTAAALAAGACCRGRVDPGLVAPAATLGLPVLDAHAPWQPVLTADLALDPTRVTVGWLAVSLVALLVTAIALRDPAAR